MAQDMERDAAFYTGVIRLAVKFTSPQWTELQFGDSIVALHGDGSYEFHKTELSFQVSELETACKDVQTGGGKILSGPSDHPGEPIPLADLVDTEGNGFMLTQHVG